MNSINHILFILIVLAISSCGGGSGGDDDVIFVGGVWSGTYTLRSNSCPWDEAVTVAFQHTINQTGTRVVVDTPATTYEGMIEGNDGFLVGQELINQEVSAGVFCEVDAGIRYDNIRNNRGDVVTAVRMRCYSGGQQSSCEVVYTGVATRR